MARVFRFLVLLAIQRFYGEVTIRFQDGRVHGRIQVNQGYVEDTLPQPDLVDEAMFSKVLHEVMTKGV